MRLEQKARAGPQTEARAAHRRPRLQELVREEQAALQVRRVPPEALELPVARARPLACPSPPDPSSFFGSCFRFLFLVSNSQTCKAST